jgi:hypothetical protein
MKKLGTIIFDMHGIVYGFNPKATPNQPYLELPGFAKMLAYYELGYKIVVISTNETQQSRAVLNSLLQDYEDDQIAKFFKEIDILTMQNYGSKGSTESWKEAMKAYDNIEHIYEDGESNLQRAGEAARQLGSHPELHSTVGKKL